MTATSTRSTRRAEGPVQRATRHHNHLLAQQSNSSRPLKRLHEATNLTYDIKPVKKAKFEIEIPSKTQYQARFFKDHQHHNSHRSSRLASLTATHNNPPKQDASSRQTTTAHPPLAPEPSLALTPAPAPAPTPTPTPAPILAKPSARSAHKTAATAKHKDIENSNSLTKHSQKVVNGIKHELDRLQPSSADMANSNSQGRKLRSQEGVRYKSELSAYFPEYDEVIGNIPKEHRMYTCPPSLLSTWASNRAHSADFLQTF